MTQIYPNENPQSSKHFLGFRTLILGILLGYVIFLPLLACGLWLVSFATSGDLRFSEILTNALIFAAFPSLFSFAIVTVHVMRLAYFKGAKRSRKTAFTAGGLIGFISSGLVATSLSMLSSELVAWVPVLVVGTLCGLIVSFCIVTIAAMFFGARGPNVDR